VRICAVSLVFACALARGGELTEEIRLARKYSKRTIAAPVYKPSGGADRSGGAIPFRRGNGSRRGVIDRRIRLTCACHHCIDGSAQPAL
jgi:hypothetical protein